MTIDSEVDSILMRLEGVTRSDTADAMNGRPMTRTFGVDDNPRATAHTAITRLIAQEANKAAIAELEELPYALSFGEDLDPITDPILDVYVENRIKALTADKEQA